jgi:uncharacterized protein YcgI (DUF1989 family)
MNTRRRTALKNIHVLAATAALVATPAAFASAADTPSEPVAPAATTASLITPGARYQLVDANGNVVGELVLRRAPKPALPATLDRAFHPDYTKSLTIGQMSAAWQAEWGRINPPVVTGGG